MPDPFPNDLRYAARLLRRSPGFTLPAIAAVALGIAANSAMFSVVNTVLLKSFAYPDPDRIVMLQSTFLAGRTGSSSPTLFNWWRQQTASFEDISAYEFNVANWTGESFPEQIPIMHVSAGFSRCAVRIRCTAGRSRPPTTNPTHRKPWSSPGPSGSTASAPTPASSVGA